MVPEVPRLAVTTPGFTFPVPTAPIILSPPPAETTGDFFKPHFCRRFSLKRPTACREDPREGNFSSNLGSINSTTGSHQRRVLTSINPVPEASPYSIRFSPVSQKLL